MTTTSIPKTFLSPDMKKSYVREQQIEKYFNYLLAFYKACGNAYTEYSHTEAAKRYGVTNNILISLRKTGFVKCLDAQGKRLYKWNLAVKPTEDHAEKLWEDVKSTSRLYTLNKRAKNQVPKNKNGKNLIPIAGSRKEIKKEVIDETPVVEVVSNKLNSKSDVIFNFLNDIYINCQLGEVKTLKEYADKYKLHATYTVVLKQKGYLNKDFQTRNFTWLKGEPNKDMIEQYMKDITEYNSKYYNTVIKNGNDTKPVSSNQSSENPPSNEPKTTKIHNNPETNNSIKDRLITKLINAGKLQEAEILLDQMLQGK